jgi:hypothetical protein
MVMTSGFELLSMELVCKGDYCEREGLEEKVVGLKLAVGLVCSIRALPDGDYLKLIALNCVLGLCVYHLLLFISSKVLYLP